MVRLYSSDTLAKLYEVKDAKQWVSDVKFSPSNGNTLAAGTHDNCIHIYALRGTSLTRIAKFSGHHSYITHIDFSRDGRILQSNCGAYELLFCEAATGRQITAASSLRDELWTTWTCTLGWPVQGIWPALSDGTDVNAVDRAHSGHLLATGDDFGKVRLYRYPCCTDKPAAALEHSGHSSHVTNVRWTAGDEYLISLGGNDKSIFQWKHSMISMGSGQSKQGSSQEQELKEEIENDEYREAPYDEPQAGDEFMAVKPWLGAIRAPTNPGPISSAAPSEKLQLEWVFGYRGFDTRTTVALDNVFYTKDNLSIVYPIASIAVRLSVSRGTESSPSASTPEQVRSTSVPVLYIATVVCIALFPQTRR
jgi:microtubule-associated protein-like 6